MDGKKEALMQRRLYIVPSKEPMSLQSLRMRRQDIVVSRSAIRDNWVWETGGLKGFWVTQTP